MSDLNKYKGCLIGLAVGDAVGTTVEFKPRGTFTPVTDMTGGGPFNLEVGQWTDDTSMALCLGESLVTCDGFKASDQMRRYIDWYENGYMSSNGVCFDIGDTTVRALKKWYSTRHAFAGSKKPSHAGNGGIMRLAPVPMYFRKSLDDVLEYSSQSSCVTHATLECIDAAKLFGGMICLALTGLSKQEIFDYDFESHLTAESIKALNQGTFVNKSIDDIKGTGYVVESLEAALWCFYNTENYTNAVLEAVNLGDDADTTAAITGQIAGAYYGFDSIPFGWIDKLADKNMIEQMAIDLFNCSENYEP